MPYDVIIAGAGLSGLAAARLLATAKKKVLLVEARNRVGGRVVRQQVHGGTWIDRGAQWVESSHKNVMQYVKALDIKTSEEYAGKGLWTISYGGPGRIVGDFPAPDRESEDAASLLDIGLGKLVGQHKVTANPWEAQGAPALDTKTLAQWILENSQGDKEKDVFARYYVDWNARFQQSGGSSQEMPLLHTLFERAVNAEDPEIENEVYLLVGGAGQIPEKLSVEVQTEGAELIRGSQVAAITQDADGVTVTTRAYTSMGVSARYQAKFAIVAMPPILSGAIHYDPPLPARRLQLVQRMPMGTIAKVACVFAEAWWRVDGRSGHALGDQNRTAQYIVDSGDPNVNAPGILTCFVQGNKYIAWSLKPENQRRQEVIDDIQVYFGGKNTIPPCVDYVEGAWPFYPLTCGAYNAYASPGAWTAYGPSLREPDDRIHWAGTEMATRWYGCMDGAISTGETAAKQVLAKLG